MTKVKNFICRSNVSKIPNEERRRLINAIIALNIKYKYPGNRDDKPFAGGVTYWFKQDEIHQSTHVHRGPAFLTWHRELCRRFEISLRLVDKKVSLHYWDWNEDPTNTMDNEGNVLNLFTDAFMGSSSGLANEPWLTAGFYNPFPDGENYRGIDPFDIEHINPADPPIELIRRKEDGTLKNFIERNKVHFYTDEEIIKSTSYGEMRYKLESVHNWAHNYIGGTIGDPHTSFRDPFVFLIHSNVDRLFAAWQQVKGQEYRLDPGRVYEEEADSVAEGSVSPRIVVGIKTMLSPWCGVGFPYGPDELTVEGETEEPGVNDVRPWAYPEYEHRKPDLSGDLKPKNSKHKSVVNPPLYDKLPNVDGLRYNYYKPFKAKKQ
jgi:Common central domain of tyrosinase